MYLSVTTNTGKVGILKSKGASTSTIRKLSVAFSVDFSPDGGLLCKDWVYSAVTRSMYLSYICKPPLLCMRMAFPYTTRIPEMDLDGPI